jgi:hypothetical protein|tara:strand:+ start:188 stop:481 length:294 start_codon:yes stop_codon:yes gene_type:complete
MPKYKHVNNELIEITGDELAEYEAREQAWKDGALDRALDALRHKRNILLAKTDWTSSSDLTMSDEMKTYRQELRDATNGLDTVEKVQAYEFPTEVLK